MRHFTIWILVQIALAGCSPTATDPLSPVGPAVVWPKPPDAPRVRYLGELRSSADARTPRSMGASVREVLEGPAEPLRLARPHAVAVDASGDQIAIADLDAHCVHLFDLAGRSHRILAQMRPGDGNLDAPVALCWVGQDLWVADANRALIVPYRQHQAGEPLGSGYLRRPSGMTCCDSSGLVYVSDAGSHSVAIFDRTGSFLRSFGTRGSAAGEFNFPSQLACGPDNVLLVADSLNFRIQRLAADGCPLGMFGQKGDAAGDLALPKGVAVDYHGRIWVTDAQFENIQAFTEQGELLMAFGREGQGPGEFWLPAGLCIDRLNRMWVADAYNRRVQVFELVKDEQSQ